MKRLFVLMMIAAVAAGAQASLFTDTFGDFESNQANGWGTTFTPAAATIDPAGTEVPQTVYLVDWTYAKTSSGGGTTAGDTYLAIFSALTVAEMDTATNLVGVSSTSVDMSLAANGSQVTWDFGYVALDKDTEYALMFVQYNAETGAMGLVSQGVELEVGNPYTAGGFIRIDEIANDWDPDFVATYSTVVPEPATMVLLGLGSLLLRRRRA